MFGGQHGHAGTGLAAGFGSLAAASPHGPAQLHFSAAAPSGSLRPESFAHAMSPGQMGFLAGAAPPSPEAASPSQSPGLSLAGMTAHVSSALGQYCRIVVGDARFRADVLARVSVVVLRWMAGRTSAVALYGRRAWNAHIAQGCLVDATTDFDIMVMRPPDFHTLRFSLLSSLRSSCPDLSLFIYAYVKSHLDSRGSTMTVEVGGTPLVDLTVRERYGDFCIGVEPQHLPEPYTVLRSVDCPAGSAHGSASHTVVSVMRRHTMFRMLRAEIRAGIWRTERAARDLERYALYETMGWFHSDDDGDGEGEGFVVSVVRDSSGERGAWEARRKAKPEARGQAAPEARGQAAPGVGAPTGSRDACVAKEVVRGPGETAGSVAAASPLVRCCPLRAPHSGEPAAETWSAPASEGSADWAEVARSEGSIEPSETSAEGFISESLPETARPDSLCQAPSLGEPSARRNPEGVPRSEPLIPSSIPSIPGSDAEHATQQSPTVLPMDVQLKLLKRHLYQAKSVEEARGCVRFFAYQEDDAVCRVIREVLDAGHLGAVYRVAHAID